MSERKKTKVKTRDRAASEEHLLNAAKQIFSKHGFNKATTRMIAKKADVNESLISRYFNGKLGLLIALIKKESHCLDTQALEYPPQASIKDEIYEFTKMKIMISQQNVDFFKIIIVQALTDSRFLKMIRETIPMFPAHTEIQNRLKKLIKAKGLTKTIDIEKMLDDIELYILGTLFFRIILRGDNKHESIFAMKRFSKAIAFVLESDLSFANKDL